MTDYSELTVQLPHLARDIPAAFRNKRYAEAVKLSAALMLLAGELALVATEKKADEMLDEVIG